MIALDATHLALLIWEQEFVLSTTSMGTIPYIRIGKSFLVEACGCKSVILKYTFGP
jgi:hypothetical protein